VPCSSCACSRAWTPSANEKRACRASASRYPATAGVPCSRRVAASASCSLKPSNTRHCRRVEPEQKRVPSFTPFSSASLCTVHAPLPPRDASRDHDLPSLHASAPLIADASAGPESERVRAPSSHTTAPSVPSCLAGTESSRQVIDAQQEQERDLGLPSRAAQIVEKFDSRFPIRASIGRRAGRMRMCGNRQPTHGTCRCQSTAAGSATTNNRGCDVCR
jgi:hypothetical protein